MDNFYPNKQNHEKLAKISHVSHFTAKILANVLVLGILAKVLLVGALFLYPDSSIAAVKSTITAEKLVELTNSERSKQGLSILIPSDILQKAAQSKAQDIIENDYFAHTTPEGKPFYAWIQESDYVYKSAGENLAISFINNEDVLYAWMASPTHKDNILDPIYQEVGIAVVQGDFNGEDTVAVVQLFGNPAYPLGPNRVEIAGTTTEGITAIVSITPPQNTVTSILTSTQGFLDLILIIAISLLLIIVTDRLFSHKWGMAVHRWYSRLKLMHFSR